MGSKNLGLFFQKESVFFFLTSHLKRNSLKFFIYSSPVKTSQIPNCKGHTRCCNSARDVQDTWRDSKPLPLARPHSTAIFRANHLPLVTSEA